MKRFIVGSTWDRTNRNGINNNFDYLFEGVKTMNNLNIKADATLLKADAVLMNAQNINQSNVDVQNQLDQIIVESGTSDAEVVQSRYSYNGEEFTTLKNRLDKRDKNLLTRIVNVVDFDVVGDGVADDTTAIQSALDYAKDNGGELFLPEATYLISSTLYLNGVTLRGNVSNIFVSGKGTIIKCATKDFKAVAQGSTSVRDIQFNISNIIIEDALVGLELNYVINSKYENIYVKNSDIAYKLGDKNSVGSMFNEFNNLYTRGCRIGIESDSKDFFNNNVFNNGYIQGTDYAAKISVTGGYGAVNNTFNNVELRSPLGRGLILHRSPNTILNNCYLEVGGNAVRVGINSSVVLKDCVYGMFESENTNGDEDLVFFEENASFSDIDGGRIFLNPQYEGKYFLGATSKDQYWKVNVIKNPVLSGTNTAPNFNRFRGEINKNIDMKTLDRFVDLKLNRHSIARGQNHYISDYNIIKNTEKIDGSKITLTKGYWSIDVTLKMDLGTSPATKYVYLRKNGTTFASETHVYNTPEHSLRKISLSKVEFFNEGDSFDVFVMFQEGDPTIDLLGGSQSFVTLKYLG